MIVKRNAVRRVGRPVGSLQKQSGLAAVAQKVRSKPNISYAELARRVRGHGLSPASIQLYATITRQVLKAI